MGRTLQMEPLMLECGCAAGKREKESEGFEGGRNKKKRYKD